MCVLRSLQRVTGEALASILVKIYLQEELNQGQPALVSRASMLGPGLERRRFLHRKTRLLPPSLSTRGSVISYMARKEETYYCKRKIGFFSPSPHLHLGKWKERWTISISTHVCIHESVYWHSAVCSIKTQTSTHTLFLSLSHMEVLSAYRTSASILPYPLKQTLFWNWHEQKKIFYEREKH